QSEVKLQAGIDNLFDDFAQLVDLDRENASIFIAITELRHRGLKGAINRFDAVPEQILKPDYQRKTESTVARFVYDLEKVDATAVFLEWTRLDVPCGINCKVTAAPSLHIVSGDSGLNVPLGFHFNSSCGRKPQSAHSIRASNMQVHLKNFLVHLFTAGRSRSTFLARYQNNAPFHLPLNMA